MNNIKIIGAGMAGLLAGNMLRRFCPQIVERYPILPDNHSALLRFRSTDVSSATGIPFKKVLVRKGIWDGERIHTECNIQLANRYSRKIANGAVQSRSIWNTEADERFIAPPDFIRVMAQSLNISFGTPFGAQDHLASKPPVISTVPMPLMMKLFGYDDGKGEFDFQSFPIFVLKGKVLGQPTNVYQTIYNSGNEPEWYRATIHGDELTVEGSLPTLEWFDVSRIFNIFGLDEKSGFKLKGGMVEQKFGKILPFDSERRKMFIIWLTENYNIYSLGRFATWRPLLLDDLVGDIKKIEQMIESPYHRKQLQS